MAELKRLQLFPAQREFFEWGPSPLLFMGGIGAGKSYILVLKMLYLLDEYPGSRGLIARQRFQQLKKTTSATLWKLLPKEKIARRNDNEGTLTLTNGSQLLLMHLDSADSLSNLKSLEISFGAIDQAEDVSAEAWDTLWERIGRWTGATKRGGWPKDWPHKNRLGDCIPPRYLFANCYSPGYGHYLTERFWEFGGERDRYRQQGYKVVSGSSRTNLALSDDYVRDLLARGDEFAKRYVDALDWGATEGAIFDLTPRSILEPTAGLLWKIKNTMRLHRVYDHGEAVPSAYLWYATDSEGNVYFYREGGGANMLVSEHRAVIYELSKEDGEGGAPPKYYSNIADPAIFAKTRGRSINSAPTWSVADEFRDQKIMDPRTAIYFRPANNDEAMTINRVREYLKPDPTHRHPLTGKLGSPRLFFVKKTDDYPYGCHEVLVDIRAAKRKEQGVMPNGTKLYSDERDDQIRDHWLDCVAPETRILTADLRWIPASRVAEGDRLVGFDERSNGKGTNRKIRESVVEHVSMVRKPSYRLTFDDGTEVVCSFDHQWLSVPAKEAGRCGGSQRKWIRTEDLDGESHWAEGRERGRLSGDRLVLKPLDPWPENQSYEAGYLAGVFDGEGSLSLLRGTKKFMTSLIMSQKDNACLRTSQRFLESLGYRYVTYDGGHRNGCYQVRVQGGMYSIMTFLGSIRPKRLLSKFVPKGRFQCKKFVAVTRREFIGDVDLVSIQTTTRTFFAEGLASHNCTRYAIGLRPALAHKIHVEEDEPNAIKIHDYFEAMDDAYRGEVQRGYTGGRY